MDQILVKLNSRGKEKVALMTLEKMGFRWTSNKLPSDFSPRNYSPFRAYYLILSLRDKSIQWLNNKELERYTKEMAPHKNRKIIQLI